GTLKGDVVVGTVMSNLGLVRAMRDAGIELVQTRVGDRYVLEEMERRGALLTAVRFLSLAMLTGRSVGDLAAAMRRYPQVTINVPVDDREGLVDAATVEGAVARDEAGLGERGRVLVPPSGAEPLIRVMVGAETEDEASRHAGALADAIRHG